MTVKIRVHLWSTCLFIVLVCASHADCADRAEVRLKLADGSYMTVDDAWESPQGVWYRKGGLSHLLPKDKVKKIERSTPRRRQLRPSRAIMTTITLKFRKWSRKLRPT